MQFAHHHAHRRRIGGELAAHVVVDPDIARKRRQGFAQPGADRLFPHRGQQHVGAGVVARTGRLHRHVEQQFVPGGARRLRLLRQVLRIAEERGGQRRGQADHPGAAARVHPHVVDDDGDHRLAGKRREGQRLHPPRLGDRRNLLRRGRQGGDLGRRRRFRRRRGLGRLRRTRRRDRLRGDRTRSLGPLCQARRAPPAQPPGPARRPDRRRSGRRTAGRRVSSFRSWVCRAGFGWARSLPFLEFPGPYTRTAAADQTRRPFADAPRGSGCGNRRNLLLRPFHENASLGADFLRGPPLRISG